MTAADSSSETRLDTAAVSALFEQHRVELERFLVGLLRDHQLAADVLQTTFTRLLQRGGETNESTRRGWLFRVAYNEAMLLRRKATVNNNALRKIAWSSEKQTPGADETILQSEMGQAVRKALESLPEIQREVVRLRIYEEKTFKEIARQLNIPLGTALARMRTALSKLRSAFIDQEDTE